MTQRIAPNTEHHETIACPHCEADLRAGPALPNALEDLVELLDALMGLVAWVDPNQTYFGNNPALDTAYVAIGKDRSNVIECGTCGPSEKE